MDKSKGNQSVPLPPIKRGIKGKGAPAPGESLIVLGTGGPSPSSSAASKAPAKRDAPPISAIASKKPKLSSADKPISVESYELLERLESEENDDRICGYILASITSIKASRGRDHLSMLTLLYQSMRDPSCFQNDQIVEALVAFLKRDPGFSFKSKPSNSLQVFAANVLLSVLGDMGSWPTSLTKVFIEDSLAERIWVDSLEVKGLVDNIMTGFKTYIPNKSVMNPDVSSIKNEAPNSPNIAHNDDSSDSKDLNSDSNQRLDDVNVVRRYTTEQEEQISNHVKEIVVEQLNRRPASEISRNLLRLLMATVGVQSIRALIAQKLEVWLQNPKLQKPAQDLSRFLVLNLTESDTDVVGILIKTLQKIRSKPIVNHFISCVKELIVMKEEMGYLFLREAVVSFMQEITTTSRGSNNMQLISTIFTAGSTEKSTKTLAALFQEFAIKDECLKTLRILLRELVRTLRYDNLNLCLFVSALVEEHSAFAEIDQFPNVRDRIFQSTIDIITLSMFLCVSPSIKEAVSAPKSDRRDVMRNFQMQVADICRSGVCWLRFSVPKLMLDRNEFMHGLNKLLLMEGFEQYCGRDNWPPESERNLIFRLCSEVPLLEDTIVSILTMALDRNFHISPTEGIEVTECLIKRAAACYDGEGNVFPVLNMRKEEIFDLLLNCSTYRMPENIALPAGYQAPSLAVSDWYWKVWVQLLILTAHNTSTFGHRASQMFPTLSLMIEMSITSHFEFPPPTQSSEDLRVRDSQISALEKQQILQFETHLAAASTKMLITESNSLLISKLITFDPTGAARKPPSSILDQLKIMNTNLKLGHLLCQSRNPDFLLEIIQRQQKSKIQRHDSGGPVSMPWLNQLVELHEDNYSALSVQCLCEFLLGQIHEDVSSRSGTNNNSSRNNASTGTVVSTSATNADKVKEKEKKRKLKKLIVFFKNMLSEEEEGTRVAREMIDYFMKRLGCQQSLFRSLASKALDVILTPTSSPDQQDFPFDFSSSTNDGLFLEMLPQTRGFESVKQVACEALRWSLLVETSPISVSKYVAFLADHSLHSDSEITMNLAHLLIERQIVMRAIVSHDDDVKHSFLLSANKILHNYLIANLLTSPPQDWPVDDPPSERVLVVWTNGQTAVIHVSVIHAIVMLLIYGPVRGCEQIYDDQMNRWFCDPPPKAYLIETREEEQLLPDSLKLFLARSSCDKLVDAGLADLDTRSLVLFIQSFGLPVESMTKLLKFLDERCESEDEKAVLKSSIPDEKFMRHLIQVQWMRGVTTGQKFAAFLGLEPELPVESRQVKKSSVSPSKRAKKTS